MQTHDTRKKDKGKRDDEGGGGRVERVETKGDGGGERGIEPLFPSRKRPGESRETRIRQIEVCAPRSVRGRGGSEGER